MALKILITEDDALVRKRLENLFQSASDFQLLNVFPSAKLALEFLEKKSQPDILLADLEMPGMKGDELIAIVRKKYPKIKIAVFTVFEDQKRIYQLLKLGIKGYMLKDTHDELLLAELKVISLGGATLTERVAQKILDDNDGDEQGQIGLSQRETEVLNLIALGLNYKDIANELDISPNTVRRHIESIYSKLEVNTKVEAINKADRLGFFR